MGEFVDKVKGATNEAIGKAKVAIGQDTDNAATVAKGLAQQAKGNAQAAMGTIKGKLGDRI